MEILKLNSATIGSHFGEQAVIFSEKGEIFVTKDELTAKGFELIKFQTYDVAQLTTIVNNVLKGIQIKSAATVEITNKAIAVSPVTNLYRIDSSTPASHLLAIQGGYDAQIITLTIVDQTVEIKSQGNIKLKNDFIIPNEYSIILLQKVKENWIEVSRKVNN